MARSWGPADGVRGVPVLDRRIFIGAMLAAGASTLPGCGSGGNPQKAAEGALLLADGSPNPGELMKPGPLGDKVLGKPDAPVTIIEYASLTCPHCHRIIYWGEEEHFQEALGKG